jgi:hypothetical protein
LIWCADSISAQGSIFGAVTNSDASTPDSGDIAFIGYLDDTDEEIRIVTSIGAGYDNGNWYDDFQNYLTEAPGNPYDYHFHNLTNGEGFVLSKAIPNNSFQEEDIVLGAVGWPDPPAGFGFEILSPTEVRLHWQHIDGLTWHVYRREAISNGSFFRLDDPSGSLANPGTADTFFVDATVSPDTVYAYLIIPEDQAGNLGPPSEIVTVDTSEPQFLAGDANGDGIIDIGDPIFVIAYIFRGGPIPDPYDAADANCDGIVDIGDPIYIIAYIFRGGPPPTPCP